MSNTMCFNVFSADVDTLRRGGAVFQTALSVRHVPLGAALTAWPCHSVSNVLVAGRSRASPQRG